MREHIPYGHPDYNKMAQSTEATETETENKKTVDVIEDTNKKGFFGKKNTDTHKKQGK